MGCVRVGLDIGSTTVKAVVLDEAGKMLFSRYVRHQYRVRETVLSVLRDLARAFSMDQAVWGLTGMGAMELASEWGLPFIQELYAEARALVRFAGGVDAAIELGGEDAKVTYFRAGEEPDQRMNRSCAGGTGAFLDHLAAFLGTDAKGLSSLAVKGQRIYPVAARCGVFARTDVQGLLNEGAEKPDIALSVFQAIVNQVVSGLARGRPIRRRVAFLGGPLTFMPELRRRFIETLHVDNGNAVLPVHSELYAALGAAISAGGPVVPVEETWRRISGSPVRETEAPLIKEPLFASKEAYESFCARHRKAQVAQRAFRKEDRAVWLGVDAGSTTLKAVLIGGDGAVLKDWYWRHEGDVLAAGKVLLKKVYAALLPGVHIAGSGVTGYGEEILRAAFRMDLGEVETMAHLRAARFFSPNLTALLDIGGQDMKYIRLENGVVSSISLNSACASGCGSFLETFGETLGMDIRTFADRAVHAPYLLDLGYRCTVLMNARVRQVQQQPINMGALAAGLSMAVVKNALYRVIRMTNPEEMGGRIVVEGGTFYNDAVLRSLEMILGKEVVRPDLSGLMGAYGMALLARETYSEDHVSGMALAEEAELLSGRCEQKRCGGCGNRCMVTIRSFSNGASFLTGNRCERGERLAQGRETDGNQKTVPDLYSWMRDQVFVPAAPEGTERGTIGIPAVLSMWQDFPYWTACFASLGYRTVLSSFDERGMGETAETIPEGIFCHACQLAHVHIWDLLRKTPDCIWLPMMPRGREEPEIDERRHAGYGGQLKEAMKEAVHAAGIPFLTPALPSLVSPDMVEALGKVFPDISKAQLEKAAEAGRQGQVSYWRRLREETARVLEEIRRNHTQAVVLCGRDYHTDPQIHKGIPHLFTELGVPVLSGLGVMLLAIPDEALLSAGDRTLRDEIMAAAALAEREENIHLVQLHSVSCGYDGLTIQEAERRLGRIGKMYTVLSLDQGCSAGALRIRIRSLLAQIRELEMHPEARKRLYAASEGSAEAVRWLYLPPIHPLYDTLLAAAFGSSGYTVRQFPAGRQEEAAFLPEETGETAARMLGAWLSAGRDGVLDTDGGALLVLSSRSDADRLRSVIEQIKRGGGTVYFDGGRRGGTLPVTLDLLHRFFAALFLGDFLLRCTLVRKRGETGEIKALLPACEAAVRKGTFAAYEETLALIGDTFRNLGAGQSGDLAIGIEGNPFHALADMEAVRLMVEKENGRILIMGLGEWYAKELNEVYWTGTFAGRREEAEICLAARNMAGVYLDAFGKAVAHAGGLDLVDGDKEKRAALAQRMNHAEESLPEEMRDLLRRGAAGILRLTGIYGLQKSRDAGNIVLSSRYPGFPQMDIECFDGAGMAQIENRIRLFMEDTRRYKERRRQRPL